MIDEIKNLPFYHFLTKNEQEIIKNRAFIKSYEKSEIIYNSGNECVGLIFVMNGEIRTYLLSEEGREVTLFNLKKDDVCVLSASCIISQITFDTNMIASFDTKILIIPSDVVMILEQNINVKCFLYELATKRFSDVMWAMQQILFKRLDQRLSSFLLEKYYENKSVEIQITHEQIAKHISSAREVVARMLKQFSCEDLILQQRNKIIIKDVDKLKKLV